jgi:hypothetical protein
VKPFNITEEAVSDETKVPPGTRSTAATCPGNDDRSGGGGAVGCGGVIHGGNGSRV